MLRHLGLTACLGLLVGCASSSQLVQKRNDDGVDWAKVDRISRAAESRGAQVYWIRPPRSQPAKTSNESPSG
jgi:hypothetical protein